MEITFKEIEVTKLKLQPGETIVITMKIEDLAEGSMQELGRKFREMFPNNKVAVINLGLNDEIKFQTVLESASCGSSSTSYCNDCNCGKREQIEGDKS